jgi:hypothetical protein
MANPVETSAVSGHRDVNSIRSSQKRQKQQAGLQKAYPPNHSARRMTDDFVWFPELEPLRSTSGQTPTGFW